MDRSSLEFITLHADKSSPEVALLLSKNKQLPSEFIINQINGRQKSKSKFPFLVKYSNFIYPNQRAIAQASSEKAANYKSAILKAKSVLDLSGGMGLDSYFFSKYAERCTYVELNLELAKISESNFKVLGAKNISVVSTSAEDFLIKNNHPFDLIYIDPDRRKAKEKAFKIDECEPNVSQILPLIWNKTQHCMIKLSPMLDISQALTQLHNCKEVFVVAVDNDCKELIFILEKNYSENPIIKTINIKKEVTEFFNFSFDEEQSNSIELSDPLTYLYEPNSAIMKAGAFKMIAKKYNLKKIATNTHLYTSSLLIENFPGKTLQIDSIEKPKKGFVEKINIVTRNFPQTVEQIKKKYNIKEGGTKFLYACRLQNGSAIFLKANLVDQRIE